MTTNDRLKIFKRTYVYEKIATGDFLVYLKEFPYVSAVGKTKLEAIEQLNLDLIEISYIYK